MRNTAPTTPSATNGASRRPPVPTRCCPRTSSRAPPSPRPASRTGGRRTANTTDYRFNPDKIVHTVVRDESKAFELFRAGELDTFLSDAPRTTGMRNPRSSRFTRATSSASPSTTATRKSRSASISMSRKPLLERPQHPHRHPARDELAEGHRRDVSAATTSGSTPSTKATPSSAIPRSRRGRFPSISPARPSAPRASPTRDRTAF